MRNFEVVPVSSFGHVSHSKLGNLKSGHLSHWKLGNLTKKEKDRGFGSCSLSMNHHLQTPLRAALEVALMLNCKLSPKAG